MVCRRDKHNKVALFKGLSSTSPTLARFLRLGTLMKSSVSELVSRSDRTRTESARLRAVMRSYNLAIIVGLIAIVLNCVMGLRLIKHVTRRHQVF